MADSVQVDLSASLEDYFEAIFRIVQEKSAARAKDIGKRLTPHPRSRPTAARHRARRIKFPNSE